MKNWYELGNRYGIVLTEIYDGELLSSYQLLKKQNRYDLNP